LQEIAKVAAKKNEALPFSERINCDFATISVPECCDMRGISSSQFYLDLQAGKVAIVKFGRISRVRSPIARKYAAGESIA
jgi:hypothetical protein